MFSAPARAPLHDRAEPIGLAATDWIVLEPISIAQLGAIGNTPETKPEFRASKLKFSGRYPLST